MLINYLCNTIYIGPSSVTLSDIYMTKMENDIVVLTKPVFYRRYVDDIYNRSEKNTEDKLYHSLNNYHKNIKLTTEVSPTKFLDTHLYNQNGTYITHVHRKETKTPTHCSSCIPKRYNSITTDLHRAKRIATDFNKEVKIIIKKFIKADYPKAFINNVIKQFNQDQLRNEITKEDEPLVPSDVSKIEKLFHLLYLPYCEKNEAKSKDFIKKFHEFTNTNFRIVISWKTRKTSSLFSLKDKKLYPSCKIYYGKCKQCGEDYVGETKRNCLTSWREHDNPTLNQLDIILNTNLNGESYVMPQ